MGETLKVRVLNVERNGKIRLSHREAMRAAGLPVPEGKKSEGGENRGGDRGGRGGRGGRGQRPRGGDNETRRSRRPRGEKRDDAPAEAKAPAPAADGGGESAPAAN